MNFNELNLSEEMLKSLEEIGFNQAMDIQAQAIPYILEGYDIIGQAQTGTGKTAAFGIPLIEMSSRSKAGIEHLIISPTRELANQIKVELEQLAKKSKITVGLIVGGVSYTLEYAMLKRNPQIIVATPGRLLDHLKNNKINLSSLKTLTLDEADEMLNIGFKEELNAIIDFMPKNRQSLLFSATMDKDVKELARKMLTNPKEVLVSSGLATVDSVKQYGVLVEESKKFDALMRLLNVYKPETVMIFGRTKRRADELANALSKNNYQAFALHGDLSQRERSIVMEGFRNKQFPILVATDVAARGIHVDNISCVINFDLPQEIEYYVHRIGRTGRAGQEGFSITLLRKSEFPHLQLIEKATGAKIEIVPLPDKDEIKKANDDYLFDTITTTLQNADMYKYYPTAKKLIESYGAEIALAAALHLLQPTSTNAEVELTGEPPVRVKFVPQKKESKKKGFYSGNQRSGQFSKNNNFNQSKKQFPRRQKNG